MVKRVLLLMLILYCTMLVLSGTVSAAGHAKKPRPPLNITIQPVQADVLATAIQPGDTIPFRVTAVAYVDTQELRVTIELSGGAELVSGETTWTGTAARNEKKEFILTVRAPQKGRGKISAHAAIPGTDGPSFAVESRYLLGVEPNMKSSLSDTRPRVKKEGHGRDVIEYR
jgi:hypothetical protein